MFFGPPRAGKSTLACRTMLFSDYEYNFSNFETNLSTLIPDNFLGQFAFPEGSALHFDEAGISFNNRNYKNFSGDAIEYVKLHGHFINDIYLYSQSWEDVDITLRRLVEELWYIKRKGPFTLCRKLRKDVRVNKETEQIIDGYRFAGLLWNILPPPFHEKTIMFFYRKPYYKHFDSYSRPAKFLKLPTQYLKKPQL